MSYLGYVSLMLDYIIEGIWFVLGFVLGLVLRVLAFLVIVVVIWPGPVIVGWLFMRWFGEPAGNAATMIAYIAVLGLVWLMAQERSEQEGPPDQGA